jgi:hypothetical protein
MGTMTLKEGAALKPELMREAIKDTGFTLTWMKLKARGMVTEHEGSPAFKVDGSGQTFALLENDVLAKLRADPGLSGKEILVIGAVEEDDPVVLRLESFEAQ